MANTAQQGVIDIKKDQRGVVFRGVDHDRIANAIRYLSYAKLYYPLEYGFFTKSLSTLGATWSMEDGNFIKALYEFEAHFQKFLTQNPEAEQNVNLLSPKQMVDRVDEELIQDAQTRREVVRKTAKRVVAESIKQQRLQLNIHEKEELEKAAGEAIYLSATGITTTQELQQAVEERIVPIVLAQKSSTSARDQTDNQEGVTQAIQTALREDPKALQQIFLSGRGETITDRVIASSLPDKRALHTIINNLPIDPKETGEEFFDRAESVARAATVASSGLSREAEVVVEPGNLLSALLATQGGGGGATLLNKLSVQEKNVVAIIAVSRAWEGVVDSITKRAGGALSPALHAAIHQGNSQWGGQPSGAPPSRVASVVSDILTPILTSPLENYLAAQAVNFGLPQEKKLFSGVGGVAAHIDSLSSHKDRQEQSAVFALFLGTVARDPGGVRFELQQGAVGALQSTLWTMRFTAESAIGKIVQSAAQGGAAQGFFGKIISPVLGFFGIQTGVKVATGAVAGRVAGGALGKALGSLIGFFSTGPVGAIGGFVAGSLVVPVFNKVKGWASNLLAGRVGSLGAVIGALEQTAGAQGKPKKWYEQDWVVIIGVLIIALLLPMIAMTPIITQNSALFVASAPNNTGGPYTETFPPYNGPFPGGPTAITSCAVDYKHLTQTPFDPGGIGTHKNTCAYDFDAPWNMPVTATHDGCVAAVTTNIEDDLFIKGSYGNYVLLAGTGLDGKPFYSLYAHLGKNSSPGLTVGSCVSAGTILGNVDDTGHSTGTHLHLEFLNENQGKITKDQCYSTFALPAGCTQ